jgi:site-specific DNA-methyltransferase (adenine-specific)
MAENTLYFGDNLKILRDSIRDETVDLIYLDPRCCSSPTVREGLDHIANYNVLFRSPKGQESRAQITGSPTCVHVC